MFKTGHLIIVFIISLILMSPVAFAVSVTNYTYDANGNMISDGSLNFSYDGSNNMVNVTDAGSGSVVEQYFYDHSGNRVKKVENTSNSSITTYYVSDLFEVVVYNDSGVISTVNTSYYYANGERIARKAVNGSDSETYYYHSDHLQSTSVVTRKGRLVAGTASVGSGWSSIDLGLEADVSLVQPVIVSKIMTENEGDNSEKRLKNVTSNSFQLRVEETPAFDGAHASETLGYVALEEGLIANDEPAIGEAGTIEAGDVWTRVSFAEKFDSIPVVVASSMTANNDTQGVVRVRNIGIAGFDVRFEEYPSDFDDFHSLETIGWIAIEPGTWTLDGKKVTAWTVGGVTDSYSSVSFQTLSSPVILSQIQSYNEADYGSHTRVKNVSTTGFSVKIEEETDTPHIAETVGYIAIESGTLKSGSAKVSETKYYPYGVTQEGGSDKYLYTGKELDKGTGLYYYEARYYNPNVGRFIQPDTLIPDAYNPQSLNRYSYVLNNPLRYTDPNGELAWIPVIIVGVVLVDFLWTYLDTAKYEKIAGDPNQPPEVREDANENLALIGITTSLDPGDVVIPGVVGLPTDDIARVLIKKGIGWIGTETKDKIGCAFEAAKCPADITFPIEAESLEVYTKNTITDFKSPGGTTTDNSPIQYGNYESYSKTNPTKYSYPTKGGTTYRTATRSGSSYESYSYTTSSGVRITKTRGTAWSSTTSTVTSKKSSSNENSYSSWDNYY